MDGDAPLRAKLAALRTEHRRHDETIEAIARDPLADQLELRRLKKRKLALRDEIRRLEDDIVPDILA